MQAGWDAANGLQIGRDVVAGGAIAAGRAAGKHPLLVAQVDGDAINLRLDDPFQLLARKQLLHSVDEIAHVLLRVGIVQAEHRLHVLHLLEFFQRLAANPLRRRVGRDKLRELLLQVQ